MSDVAVVTDSTAYLPPGMAATHGIAEVPLHVVLGSRTGTEGLEVSPGDVASALAEGEATEVIREGASHADPRLHDRSRHRPRPPSGGGRGKDGGTSVVAQNNTC